MVRYQTLPNEYKKLVHLLDRYEVLPELYRKGEWYCDNNYHLGKIRGPDAAEFVKRKLRRFGINATVEKGRISSVKIPQDYFDELRELTESYYQEKGKKV